MKIVALRNRFRHISPMPQDDPTGFWMSEKLDGWFLRWDGRQFTTANGNPVAAPQWFTIGLPDRELRGELYAGSGRFDAIAGIVASGIGWETLRFAIFDSPSDGFPRPVTAHVDIPFAFYIPQIRCESQAHLDKFYADILAGGGEGVMLRMGTTLRKIKPSEDEEATVIGYTPSSRGFGIGSLMVASPSRGEFGIAGMSDAVRLSPPSVGETITFKFSGLTKNGKPKSAMFLRARPASTLKIAA